MSFRVALARKAAREIQDQDLGTNRAGKPPAVGVEGHHATCEGLTQRGERAVTRDLPDFRLRRMKLVANPARQDEPPAVATEVKAMNGAAESRKNPDLLSLHRVPDPHGPVAAG